MKFVEKLKNFAEKKCVYKNSRLVAMILALHYILMSVNTKHIFNPNIYVHFILFTYIYIFANRRIIINLQTFRKYIIMKIGAAIAHEHLF